MEIILPGRFEKETLYLGTYVPGIWFKLAREEEESEGEGQSKWQTLKMLDQMSKKVADYVRIRVSFALLAEHCNLCSRLRRGKNQELVTPFKLGSSRF